MSNSDRAEKSYMNVEHMEYMVWIIEIVAAEFFKNDKTLAYHALKESGLWNTYINHYDTTHTLGTEYLIEEIREYFAEKGIDV